MKELLYYYHQLSKQEQRIYMEIKSVLRVSFPQELAADSVKLEDAYEEENQSQKEKREAEPSLRKERIMVVEV